MAAKESHQDKDARSMRVKVGHPRSVSNLAMDEPGGESDQPFAEGVQDTIDADLRHRMISEAAYRRYAQRGYADGYDLDDWLQAEADVDHVLLQRPVIDRSGEAL